jgi:two-component system response regulator VicR
VSEQSKKILYIEDESVMIELVRLILGGRGFEVVGAANGRDGLEIAGRESPDLILLDLMMPDIDGWQVYRQLKAHPDLKNTPVIVVTAKAQPIDKVLGLSIAKVDDYITKPFEPKELLRSVRRVLGQSGLPWGG